MIEFMDYVQNAFYSASLWDRDNSYSTLTATANGTFASVFFSFFFSFFFLFHFRFHLSFSSIVPLTMTSSA